MTPAQAREAWLERREIARLEREALERGDGLRLWYAAIKAGWPGPRSGSGEENWHPEARAFLADRGIEMPG